MTVSDGVPVTIRDIAALAGVSAGTVSRVVNDLPGVGASTRARIAALVQEHGYRADSIARQLSRGRSESFGVVFPLQVSEVVMHPVYPELLGAITDAALETGYDVNLFTTAGERGVAHVIDAFRRKRVDGLILPAAGSDDELIREVAELDIPTVLVGHRQRARRMSWVDCTHDDAIYTLTSTALATGSRRLLLLNGPHRTSAYRLRSIGFWSAVAEFPDATAEEIESPMSYALGYDSVDRLVRGGIEAVVCGADSTAAGVIAAANQSGLRIPEQLQISGFDDTEFGQNSRPALTSVHMPLRETGQAAVALLRELVEESGPARPRLLPTAVVSRETTRPSVEPSRR